MKHTSLGGLDVSRIGLGAMTMAGTYTSGGGLDDDESVRAIRRALDLGVTLREPDIGFVPCSPLGHGLFTGQIRSEDDIADDDRRRLRSPGCSRRAMASRPAAVNH